MKTEQDYTARLMLPKIVYRGLVDNSIDRVTNAFAVKGDNTWGLGFMGVDPYGDLLGFDTDLSNGQDIESHEWSQVVGEVADNVREVELKGDFLHVSGDNVANISMVLAWKNWQFPDIVHYVWWHDCDTEYIVWVPGVSYNQFVHKGTVNEIE